MSVPPQHEASFVSSGTRLGRYEIVAPIGKGGMGEVYRARDRELQRDVALKVLAAEYGDDPERLRRFEQEARAMGQLSHPNIVAVYDVGRSEGGTPYVVTELLEGETLRDVLALGPLTPERATEYALQIARGLAAAHAKGIVHRDLKPGNIFVTSDRMVKILDFGLAKLAHPEWESFPVDESTLSMTAPGMILGTVAYMAPEQLEGAAIDFRADIFAFGAVMYEMLTGARPFTGASAASLVASILRGETAQLSGNSERIGRSLLPVVRRCLEKRPAARFQSTRDLVFALEQHLHVESSGSTTYRMIRSVTSHPTVRRTLFASVILTVTVAILLLTSGSPPSRAARSTTAELLTSRVTTDGNVFATDGNAVAVSPDATYVAYIRAGDPMPTLVLRHVPTGSEVQLRPPAWYDSVVIAPDRNYVYYTVALNGDTALLRVPLLGGEPRTIVEAIDSWSPPKFSPDGGRIVFTRSSAQKSAVWIANSDGTGARELVSRPRKEVWFHGCAWSLDQTRVSCGMEKQTPIIALALIDVATGRIEEKHGAFSQRVNYPATHEWLDEKTIVLVTLDGRIARLPLDGGPRELMTRGLNSYSAMSFARDAHVWAVAESNSISKIWNVPFGSAAAPQVILSGYNTEEGRYGIAPLRDGRFIYSAASPRSLDLWISDRSGVRRRLFEDDTTDEVRPQVSPDEKSLAFLRRTDNSAFELWISDLKGEHARKLTDHAEGPSFGPDGEWIYFTRNLIEGARLFRIPARGGEAERISDRDCAHGIVSPDGRYRLASCFGKDEKGKPYSTVVTALEGAAPELHFRAGVPHKWRPDSRGFAYVDSARTAVFFQTLDAEAPRKVASFADPINALSWSRDGSTLLVSTTETLTDVVLLRESQ
jgi:serine/threonine protein kinase